MQLLTVLEARSTLARALGICGTVSGGGTNPIVVEYANEAQQRLLNRPGKPVGTLVRYLFRANESSLVLPRQIRTVERFSICERPGTALPEWYEFQHNGPGQQTADGNIGDQFIDHGTDCKFNDITSGEVDRKLRITADVTEAASTYIWLYGYDENSNWIRTLISGTWVDGERITLTSCPVNTTNYFTQLVRVSKDQTLGTIRVYEYNTTTTSIVQALGFYEPSETNPIYRRMFIPGLADMSDCTDGPTGSKAITVLARLQHVPVTTNEQDAFVVGNLPALKLMCLAIKAEEEQRMADALQYQAMAEKEIDGELAAYLGDGQHIGLSMEDRSLFGGGNFENVI